MEPWKFGVAVLDGYAWWAWWWALLALLRWYGSIVAIREKPGKPGPIEFPGHLRWTLPIAGAIGGGVAWAVIGARLGSAAGLAAIAGIAIVGSTILGSIVFNLSSPSQRSDAPQ